ncbi:MAG: hypothetical protein ACREMF_02320 [Gemmatimonadales bacterium]
MIPAALPVVALAILVGGGIVAAVLHRNRRRREALEQYCLVRGYRFERERPGAEADLEAFGIFRQGHNRRWRATITGQIGGRPFTAFEYTYVTGGGKNSNHHRLTVMLWESIETSLPAFTLVPEGFFRRLAQRFGVKDFDFIDDAGFSRAYQLQGDDEAAVRALFTPPLRAFLAAPAPEGVKATRYQLAGAGPRLLWWCDGRLPGPDALDEFLVEGDRLRRQFLD